MIEVYVLIGNQPVIGPLLGADYRPTGNPPVPYWCISSFEPYLASESQLKGRSQESGGK